MADRPILFSAPMVRAILDGRKTMTRRLVTRGTSTVDGSGWSKEAWGSLRFENAPIVRRLARLLVPRDWLGHVGFTTHKVRPRIEASDRLWVKETHARPWGKDGEVFYRADCRTRHDDGTWKPSIHMPRWASRITLEVTSVWAQRVQDISEEDAQAEGVEPLGDIGCKCEGDDDDPGPHLAGCRFSNIDIEPDDEPHRAAFCVLWDAINGKRAPWDSNPLVWVVTFARAQ